MSEGPGCCCCYLQKAAGTHSYYEVPQSYPRSCVCSQLVLEYDGFSFLQPCKLCISASLLGPGTYQESSSGKCPFWPFFFFGHFWLLPQFAEESEKGDCKEGSDWVGSGLSGTLYPFTHILIHTYPWSILKQAATITPHPANPPHNRRCTHFSPPAGGAKPHKFQTHLELCSFLTWLRPWLIFRKL